LNDEIRARVDAEMPWPPGGFENAEHLAEFRMKQDARFLELCREDAEREARLKDSAPELLAHLETMIQEYIAAVHAIDYPDPGDPEKDKCVMDARAAIAKARGGGR
jgi:hypothetical protein